VADANHFFDAQIVPMRAEVAPVGLGKKPVGLFFGEDFRERIGVSHWTEGELGKIWLL
jgi:hypothetical protein